ncbi:hypothetical protein N7517_004730 [Penicillium concentricum]|uniref:Uncharacterized protein n=1 Tax=Penicillium concentricum TaxID=293559 RepID=A0A9W9S8T1_9EURO|nr:uncharacterized protein N7517_004730 [Penicillium concentricum]KAJ5372724.1 hypothetical protein N7517_004730 [Penicillium concentricum]
MTEIDCYHIQCADKAAKGNGKVQIVLPHYNLSGVQQSLTFGFNCDLSQNFQSWERMDTEATQSTTRRSATPGPSTTRREYVTHEQTVDPTGMHPSHETITETYRKERVQIGAEPPKVPGPIRAIGSDGEPRSEATRKELAWFLQDAAPRFRVKRDKVRDQVSFVSDELPSTPRGIPTDVIHEFKWKIIRLCDKGSESSIRCANYIHSSLNNGE